MIPDHPTLRVPLQRDQHGVIRIGESGIAIDVVIARYHQGESPESIQESFEKLAINDIYAVISYYLSHRDELDAYLSEQDAEACQIRLSGEAKYPPKVTREELEQRLINPKSG